MTCLLKNFLAKPQSFLVLLIWQLFLAVAYKVSSYWSMYLKGEDGEDREGGEEEVKTFPKT